MLCNLVLFGSELEQRAAYEKVAIPGIIRRCIEEVELRGMPMLDIWKFKDTNSFSTRHGQ